MSENQARVERDLYDHEHDEPRSSGARPRRPVADWGVGDDVFEHMPRNRFSRAAEGPPRERRFARPEAERRTSREDGAEGLADGPATGDAARDATADDAARGATFDDAARRATADDAAWDPAARHDPARDDERSDEGDASRDRPPVRPEVPRGRVDDGRRTIVIGRPEDVPSEIAAVTADRDLGDDEPEDLPAAEAPAPGERRTIRIGGRPEGSLEATRAQRRRPPRTAHERVGARPDRLAAWAVALGLLLILIAVLSAL
jgi:hypothetical protein